MNISEVIVTLLTHFQKILLQLPKLSIKQTKNKGVFYARLKNKNLKNKNVTSCSKNTPKLFTINCSQQIYTIHKMTNFEKNQQNSQKS